MTVLDRFVAGALHQRLFVLFCLVGLLAAGYFAYQGVSVEAFPDLTNNQVVVVVEAPGFAAAEVSNALLILSKLR
jgi:cobalt-zinc-cadmium resistance protein CzcA